MSRVVLVFPPAADPRGPLLAIPCLAAVLRQEGIRTDIFDLNIEGLLAVLQPNFLAKLPKKLWARSRDYNCSDREYVANLSRLAELLPEQAPQAIISLRDSRSFYNPNDFFTARQVISNCLDALSYSSPKVRFSLNPVAYDVNGIDPSFLEHLIKVTDNPDTNLFQAHWESDFFPQIPPAPDLIIGITITNRQQIIPGLHLARQLKARGYFVVLGGTVYSKFVSSLSKLPAFFRMFADGVVVYEGETALLEIVAAHRSGTGDYTRVPNFIYLNGKYVRINKMVVEDPDLFPTPDFSGLPLQRYLTPAPVLPIMLGKGCYYSRCKFCDIPRVNHISPIVYRTRSIEKVVKDIASHWRTYGCRHFVFTDDALPTKRLIQLADALTPESSRKYCFVGYARLESAFTKSLCKKLAVMGLKKIFFGLESASQRTLDHMNKGISICSVKEILCNCADSNIHFHVFAMIGLPEETEEDAFQTISFFKENIDLIDRPGNSFDIHPFALQPRTPYFLDAIEYGIRMAVDMETAEFRLSCGRAWYNTRGLLGETVESMLRSADIELRDLYCFYNGPEYPWPAFEEFAVLYADFYDRRCFRYATKLPDESDQMLYCLRWNTAFPMMIQSEISEEIKRHDLGHKAIFRVLASMCNPRFRSVAQILKDGNMYGCHDADPQSKKSLRHVINKLLSSGVLQLQPLPDEGTL